MAQNYTITLRAACDMQAAQSLYPAHTELAQRPQQQSE